MRLKSFVSLALVWLAWSTVPSTASDDNRASGTSEAIPRVRGGWEPDAALLAELDRRKVAWNYREENVPGYRLPDPLRCEDGTAVADRGQWEGKRRPETLDCSASTSTADRQRGPRRYGSR